jgi:hypothetical protein
MTRRRDISFLAWIFLGLLAGFIGSKLVNEGGEGIGFDILLGIVGAVVGGGSVVIAASPACPVSRADWARAESYGIAGSVGDRFAFGHRI